MPKRHSGKSHYSKIKKRTLRFEKLDVRAMLNVDWRNPVDNLDVDSDGIISPLDPLRIINEINVRGSRPLGSNRPSDSVFFDVRGDGSIDPLDILDVINHINANGSGARTLATSSQFATSQDIPITVGGAGEGSRRYLVTLDAKLDTATANRLLPDLLSVYLVDPAATSNTLLDRGTSGTSLFSLSANGSTEFAKGLVQWDGQNLQVDLSNVPVSNTAVLRFQLITGTGGSSSRVQILPQSNGFDPSRPSGSLIRDRIPVVAPGESLDVDTLSQTSDLKLKLLNSRYDNVIGRFVGEFEIRNEGARIGRLASVVFPGLPSGVSVVNRSGLDAQGRPYINFKAAIPEGGIGQLESTDRIRVEISNPSGTPFQLQPLIFVGAPNRPPILPVYDDQSVMPGDRIQIPLGGSDPDGDTVQYSVRRIGGSQLPIGNIDSITGLLTFEPSPAQLGVYTVEIAAVDGVLRTTKSFQLNVVSDPITSTRVSGRILDVDGTPLTGLRVEIGSIQALTDSQGYFSIDLGSGPVVSETLRVRGDLFVGAATYPFIAEKLPFMLSREIYQGYNNKLHRPIYLPKLDVDNGRQINPTQNNTVAPVTLPGVALQVAANSLLNQQGTPFSGVLSITEVPPDFTPVSLPDGVRPDMVVTIQPGEMVFTTPAPLLFPNRAGYPAGMVLNLKTKKDMHSVLHLFCNLVNFAD